MTWRPILDWSEAEVFSSLDFWGIEPHPAYRRFGLSRVSCRFCIMSSLSDLTAAAASRKHMTSIGRWLAWNAAAHSRSKAAVG